MAIPSYRDLDVWRKAMDLTVACYRLAERLPEHERFGLALQIRRASVSVPANIAEGKARQGAREFARFLSIAQGSLAEVETHLELIARLQYIDATGIQSLLDRTAEIGRMLTGLIRSLKAPR